MDSNRALDFRIAAALGASALVGLKTDLMIRRVRIRSKENIGWIFRSKHSSAHGRIRSGKSRFSI